MEYSYGHHDQAGDPEYSGDDPGEDAGDHPSDDGGPLHHVALYPDSEEIRGGKEHLVLFQGPFLVT